MNREKSRSPRRKSSPTRDATEAAEAAVSGIANTMPNIVLLTVGEREFNCSKENLGRCEFFSGLFRLAERGMTHNKLGERVFVDRDGDMFALFLQGLRGDIYTPIYCENMEILRRLIKEKEYYLPDRYPEIKIRQRWVQEIDELYNIEVNQRKGWQLKNVFVIKNGFRDRTYGLYE